MSDSASAQSRLNIARAASRQPRGWHRHGRLALAGTISLALHLALLAVQLGTPGLGLPWLELSAPSRHAVLTETNTLVTPPPPIARMTNVRLLSRPAASATRPAPPINPARPATPARPSSAPNHPRPETDVLPSSIAPRGAPTEAPAPEHPSIEQPAPTPVLVAEAPATWSVPVAIEPIPEPPPAPAFATPPPERSPPPPDADAREVAARAEAVVAAERVAAEAAERRRAEESLRDAAARAAEQRSIAAERERQIELARAEVERQRQMEAARIAAERAEAERQRAAEQARLAAERERALAAERERQARIDAEQARARADAKAQAEARAEAEARAVAEAKAVAEARAVAEAKAAAEARAAAEAARIEAGRLAAGRIGGNEAAAVPSGADLARQALDSLRQRRPASADLEAPTGAERRGSALGSASRDIQLNFYADAWQQKVERWLRLSPPRPSRHRAYEPLVTLAVVNSDGTLADVRVLRSSGDAALDDAVRRVIANAAPYAAFPPALRRQFDTLEIRRTWLMLDDQVRITLE